MADITIIKTDHTGHEVWRYHGTIIERGATHTIIEAIFMREDMDLGFTIFRKGDRFMEHFYGDRWYNVFEVHDVDNDQIKGWYCNFTRPARLSENTIQADDLALDLFVYPDGRMLVLDQEEFDALPIAEDERRKVQAALDALRKMVETGAPPFTALQR